MPVPYFRFRHAIFGAPFLVVLLINTSLYPVHSEDLLKLPTPSIERLANSGNAGAQNELGVRYHNGNGVQKDDNQALAWCLKAGLQGDLKAELNLGWLYANGVGTEKNDQLAVAWYLKAAQQGNSDAELMVGLAYRDGRGVLADPELAFDWFHKAADAGNKYARTQAGIAYLYGKGVKADLRRGFTYLLDACATDPYAGYNIAVCYHKGFFVHSNLILTYKWCLIALQVGRCDEAAALITQLQATLTPPDIQKAKFLADAFPALRKGLIQTTEFTTKFANGSAGSLN
jgi:TPR repeat protein